MTNPPPERPNDRAAPEAKLPRVRAAASGVVLVVDDEALVRATTRKMLERLGFTVCTAADGRAGVEAFCEHRAELRLVLLDLTMPRLCGAEALGEMRRIGPEVPIVLTSGLSRADATKAMSGAATAPFLQKPFGLDELERCVRRTLPPARGADAAG